MLIANAACRVTFLNEFSLCFLLSFFSLSLFLLFDVICLSTQMIVDTYRGIPSTLPPVIDILVSFPLIEVNFRFDLVHTCLHNRFIRIHTHTHSPVFFLPFTQIYVFLHICVSIRLVISYWGDRKIVQSDPDSSQVCIDMSYGKIIISKYFQIK